MPLVWVPSHSQSLELAVFSVTWEKGTFACERSSGGTFEGSSF